MNNRDASFSPRPPDTIAARCSRLALAIIVFGTALRCVVMLLRPFNFDEALTFSFIRLPWFEMFERFFSSCDMMPPLYFILLKLLGGALFWQFLPRFFSLLSGVGIMWVSYRLGSRLFSPAVGVLTCLMIACSERFIYLSSEARVYSIWTVVSLGTMYYFFLSLSHPRRVYRYLCAFFLLLSVWLHYFGVFLLLLQLGVCLVPGAVSRPFRRLLIAVSLFGLMGITTAVALKYRFYPYVFRAFQQEVRPAAALWELLLLYANHWSTRLWFIGVFVGALFLRRTALRGIAWSGSGALRFLQALAQRPRQLMVLAGIIPVLVAVAGAFLRRTYLHYPSYFLTAFAFFYLLIAWAHSVYPPPARRWLVAFAAVILVANAVRFVGLYGRPSLTVEADARVIADYLRERLGPADMVAVTDVSETLNIFHYLDRPFRQVISMEQLGRELDSGWLCLAMTEVIHDPLQLRGIRSLWLVRPLNKPFVLPESFQGHLELLRRQELSGVQIDWYRIVL